MQDFFFIYIAFLQLISTSQLDQDTISNLHKSLALKQKCLFPLVCLGIFYTSPLDHFPGSCILSALLQLITYIWWPPLRAYYLLPLVICCNVGCLSLPPRSQPALLSCGCPPYLAILMMVGVKHFHLTLTPYEQALCAHLRLLLLSKPLVLSSHCCKC